MKIAARRVASRGVRERASLAEYGFWLFLAIAVGRVNQLIPGLSSLPLAKLAILIAGGAFLVGKKRTLPPLSTDGRRLVKAGAGIICLAVLLTPTSIWRGASINFVLYNIPPLIVAVAIACAMRRSWKSLRGTFLALLLCGFVLGATAVLTSHGRIEDDSTMYDPNDLAYVLVTVLPLGLGFVSTSSSKLLKYFYASISGITLLAMLLTQSRGGLLGLLAASAFLVMMPLGVANSGLASPRSRKLKASFASAIAIAFVGLVVWSQLPPDAQNRYLTLLHLNSDYNTDLSNKTGREDIWARGMMAFEARPIGYGPQTFPMVDMLFGGKFKAPHNSYLQILVELGPLALLLLLRMYFLAFRALARTRSQMLVLSEPPPDSRERAVMARALQCGFVGNIVAGFFLSDAYSMLPWVLLALTAAISAIPAQPSGCPPRPTGKSNRRAQGECGQPRAVKHGSVKDRRSRYPKRTA